MQSDTGNCTYDLFCDNKSFVENYRNDTTATYPIGHERSLPVLIIYCILFLVAAVGNLTVFIRLIRSRRRKSRISLMIRHLAIADLIVTFIMIPVEVGWRLTVQWLAGNLACKAFLLLRAFGLYLSSNVLVCVSLDRYFAVLHPLRVNEARRRGKCMLAWAWSVSLICALPQSIVFHVAPHPYVKNFEQCVTFGVFTSEVQQMVYNLFGLIVMYFIPLIVIVIAYSAIMCEISKKSNESDVENDQTTNGRMRLRRSDITNIERARTRTLRMTVTIVVAFVICWTPYVVMTLWYTFDRNSAENVPSWLQDSLFMMAVSNSCMNPLVYGSYAMNFRKKFLKWFCCNKEQQVNLPDGANKMTAGQGDGLAKQVNKCIFTLKKVGSNITRSTAMMHAVGTPNARPDIQRKGLLPKRPRTMELPPSAEHITFLSEPVPTHGYRNSFHSDPCPHTEVAINAIETLQHSSTAVGPPDVL